MVVVATSDFDCSGWMDAFFVAPISGWTLDTRKRDQGGKSSARSCGLRSVLLIQELGWDLGDAGVHVTWDSGCARALRHAVQTRRGESWCIASILVLVAPRRSTGSLAPVALLVLVTLPISERTNKCGKEGLASCVCAGGGGRLWLSSSRVRYSKDSYPL